MAASMIADDGLFQRAWDSEVRIPLCIFCCHVVLLLPIYYAETVFLPTCFLADSIVDCQCGGLSTSRRLLHTSPAIVFLSFFYTSRVTLPFCSFTIIRGKRLLPFL